VLVVDEVTVLAKDPQERRPDAENAASLTNAVDGLRIDERPAGHRGRGAIRGDDKELARERCQARARAPCRSSASRHGTRPQVARGVPAT
jgi:hypothetical protein